MRLTTISIFAVAGSLVAPAIAKPILKAGGMAIPLARHSSSLNNGSADLDAITSHAVSIREKILTGLDNYEMNTGMMHPFAVKRSESRLRTRGTTLPLTIYEDDILVGEVSIGTPPQTLKVRMDTGSADMWVLQTGCEGISEDRELWDPQSSDSAENKDGSFRVEYPYGTVIKGHPWTDRVTIAGFTADPQSFGSVTSYTSPLQINEYADGLLGLAFPSLSKFGDIPLFETLDNQGGLANPTFSLKISSSGAEMYVGGANNMLYRGNIAYASVTHPAFWQVSMDNVRVRGNTILQNVPVILDTGANYIFGIWDQVAKLYERLDGTLVEHEGFGYYYLPCDSFPPVGLTFGGRTFEIPPEVFRLNPIKEGSPNCFGAIIGQRSSDIAFWDIGLPFLQGVYTVFDYGTYQVGFADLA